MHVLIYGNRKSIVMERLKKELYRAVSPERVEEYGSLESLSARLRRPLLGRVILVLLAVSREELSDLLSIRDLLRDILIILIRPDRDKNTISSGHALRSRYLTFSDSDFVDVAAVLGKMLENIDSN